MATTRFTNNVSVTDASWFNDVDTSTYSLLSSVSGTNTIIATGPTSLTSYSSGQCFRFIPAVTNTGSATLNISGLGAKNIYQNGAALTGGELRSSIPVAVIYDGTQFHVIGNANAIRLVTVKDFGAVGDGTTDDTTAFTSAITSIMNDGVIFIPPGTYKLTSALSTLGASGKGARLVGIGKPTLKFSGIGASTDCVTITGYNYRQIELRNLIIDCNSTGRDGVVLTQSDWPAIDNVEIKNTVRDGFVLACGTGPEWIENGEFDLLLTTIGRHGVRMQLSGADGAFINEILWKQLEIRGIAQVTAGGRAIYITSTATDPGSTFSNHNFIKTNFDAMYAGGGSPAPDVDVIEMDSGSASFFSFLGSHGWENTGAGSIGAGYAINISGGTASRFIVGPLVLSAWGLSGLTGLTNYWYFDGRNNATILNGPLGVGTDTSAGLGVDILQSTPQVRLKGTGTTSDLRMNSAFGGAAVGAIGTVDGTPMIGMANNTEGWRVLTSGAFNATSATAPAAGGSGSAAVYIGNSAGFGIYFGSGAPTVSAAKGSLYLRTDGSSTSTRAYINTNGATTWTAITTVA